MSIKVTLIREPRFANLVFNDRTMERAIDRVYHLVELHGLDHVKDVKSEGTSITVDARKYYNRKVKREESKR